MTYPDNPFIGQTIEVGGTTKQWNGYAWVNVTHGNHEQRIQENTANIKNLQTDITKLQPTSGNTSIAFLDQFRDLMFGRGMLAAETPSTKKTQVTGQVVKLGR